MTFEASFSLPDTHVLFDGIVWPDSSGNLFTTDDIH